MKTVMQELIEWAISLQDNQQQCTDWIVIKNKAESLLEKEREQIEKAYREGVWIELTPAYEYYDETYSK